MRRLGRRHSPRIKTVTAMETTSPMRHGNDASYDGTLERNIYVNVVVLFYRMLESLAGDGITDGKRKAPRRRRGGIDAPLQRGEAAVVALQSCESSAGASCERRVRVQDAHPANWSRSEAPRPLRLIETALRGRPGSPRLWGEQAEEGRGDGSPMRLLKNASRSEAPTPLRLIETALRGVWRVLVFGENKPRKVEGMFADSK